MTTHSLAQAVKQAAPSICLASSAQKNEALHRIKEALCAHAGDILKANQKDLLAAKESGIREPMVDRLLLDQKRLDSMADGVSQIAAMTDPVGEVVEGKTLPNGLKVEKVRVPFGVIGVIFESRPNVAVDAACLCLKSGNAVLLRGGKEAIHTTTALVSIMQGAVEKAGFSPFILGLVQDTSRESAREMMHLRGLIDLLIPRGGAGLIRSVAEQSRVPVIETGTGNCHIYVDKDADVSMALRIVRNAKLSRPSVCNAAESLLVHASIADRFLPLLKREFDREQVTLFGCERTCALLGDVEPAEESDYAQEYLDLRMSVKIVDSTEEATEHIARFSTGHSECIVTNNLATAEFFLGHVDSAAVYVNASTRFTDGEVFGYGAEIGISTQKLHARGPMGLRDLTSYKYIIRGSGQIRT